MTFMEDTTRSTTYKFTCMTSKRPLMSSSLCKPILVHHLLANDAGPIEFVPAPAVDDTDRVVDLFAKAGLLDEQPSFVAYAEFESFDVPLMAP